MGKRKPWLNYHKPGAPVREFHESPKKPRELFWARFWLIAGLQIGAHRIYLWQYKRAFVWFLIFQMCAVLLMIFTEAIFPKNIEKVVSIGFPLLWIAVIAIEYRRLPKLVLAVNQKQYGSKVLESPLLRGEIGPYSAMGPVSYLVGIIVFVSFVIGGIWVPNSFAEAIAVIIIFISITVWFTQLARVKKSMKASE